MVSLHQHRQAPAGDDDRSTGTSRPLLLNPLYGGGIGNDGSDNSNSRWQDETTPSSSTQTSDMMTPDTDSEDDDEDDHVAVPGVLYDHDMIGPEEYEMSERRFSEKQQQHGDYESTDDMLNDGNDVAESSGGRRQRGRQGRRRGASFSTTASFQLYTPDEEKAVVRKFDRRLVIFVALLYMLSFLDRSNIGNARIAGMDDDLQTSPPRSGMYEWALSAFYIAYIAFEWMSLLWRLIPAHIYISVLVLSWGLVASLQAVAVSYPMLIFLRTLLGIGEAGFTGIPFYLSFFFKRDELAFRTAIFISAAPLATSFASSLAWLIIKLGESSPVAPWRLLFLVEGFPSVLVAIIAWNVIPDSPQTASYLTKREKKVARLRLRREKEPDSSSSSSPTTTTRPRGGLNTHDLLSVLLDPVAWLTAAIFFLTNMAYSSLPVFLPTILTAMGHDALSAQALAAPPYLAAFLIVLATAHASDAMRARAPLLIAHALASAAGYGVLALADSSYLNLSPGSMVRYLAVYPAAIGFFNVVVLTIAWSINNQRNESRQGGGFALLQVVGQCGPLVGTRLYPDGDAPYYTRGMRVCAGAMLGVAVLAGVLRWYLVRLNRRADGKGEGEEMSEEEGGDRGEEEEALVGGAATRRRKGGGGSGGGGASFRFKILLKVVKNGKSSPTNSCEVAGYETPRGGFTSRGIGAGSSSITSQSREGGARTYEPRWSA
ncbi:major facilitator superfamily domain-containing protein [Bombardia bombarda]|uniref:Major facilitator superfamily domain-containing protein n=1 Tax=Bombardia bombarda TaxID=252184 RepID=A0AA40C160_9PEZI|nr:major facilitator superfamily domain-containing protein [Bombardia bombarda]